MGPRACRARRFRTVATEHLRDQPALRQRLLDRSVRAPPEPGVTPMAEATEVAMVLAQLVCDHRAFPDEAARDLHRMLGHRIAVPSPGELRYDRLQLLLAMMLDTGVVPTVDEYQARRAADADARQAPAASTLIVAYGQGLVRAGPHGGIVAARQPVPRHNTGHAT